MYTVITHPRSGERYAAEVDKIRVLRAYGPLAHNETADKQDLRNMIDNQPDRQAEDDAAWLNGELGIEPEEDHHAPRS